MIMGIASRVVFWTVFAAAVVPSAWFVATSFFGLQKIVDHIHKSNSGTTLEYLGQQPSPDDDIATIQEIIRAHLEFDTIKNRQARANSALATRTWLRFMSSGFGSILILVGAIFLLSKVETRSESAATGHTIGAEFSIKSTSPGIIMVFVGAVLMVSPNYATQEIKAQDGWVYVSPLAAATGTDSGLESGERPSDSPEAIEVLSKIRSEGGN